MKPEKPGTEEFPMDRQFQWQERYGAFSIGISQTDDTVRYIERQREHHAKQDFKAEFLVFPDQNRIEYDRRDA